MLEKWQKFKVKLACFVVDHDWSLYSGWYEERVHPSAFCYRCGKKASEE